MEAVADDDFGELYADVEMQATSAISAIQALTELSTDTEISVEDSGPLEVNEGVISGENANAGEEKEVDVSNGQLNATESGSDGEDDFDIVLNDDNAKDSNNGEKVSCNAELRSGNWINEEENSDELENYFGVGGKGGFTNGGHSPLHKYGKSPSAKHSSYLEIKASIGVPSYSSTLNRGVREDASFTRMFGTRSIVNQNGPNFSLPRSRIILDVNIDAFDHKPWRHPGADLTDYFNFGLNEDSWKKYCNNLNQEIASQHAAITSVTMDVPEKAAKSKQQRAASPADENFSAEQPLEMPKGRPIEVQDGKERLPSADTMHPIERDSDVIIQIPVQDIQDNCLILNKVPFDQSTKCPHKASVNEDASGDVEDMQNFSSDGEDKSLKMERLAGGTGKPVSERCLRRTSGRDKYPVSMDPDKNGCLMLPDPDEQFQLTDSDSDGMPEVEGNFQEPKKTVGRCRETAAAQSRKKLESFHGKQRRRTRSSSPSETFKGGVCARSGEYEDHPKRALTNSDSGFRDAVKVDIRSGKDFRKSGISSRSFGENKYFGRRNNFKLHERKHSRMPVLENHLDDESASYMSGGEFYDKLDYKRRSPMVRDTQISRMHPYVSHKEKNDFYDEIPKYSSNRENERLFNCPLESPYDACPRERGHRDFDSDRDQGQSLIPKGKQHFLERISVMRGEEMELELHQQEREFFAHEMDILESTRVNELITESSQYFDNKFCTRRKRKAEEHYLNGSWRTGTGGFINQKHCYPNDFTRDEIRSIPCYERVADHMETKYARHLLYDRRDYAKSRVTDERKHDGLLNCDETFCPATYDEMGSRCTRDGLSLNTYKDHQNTSCGNGKSATSPRDGVFQRNGSLKRLNRTELCRDSNTLVNCSDDFEYDMITNSAIFMEEFPKRVLYQKSEVLSWDELDYNSDIPYDCLQADRTPSPFDRRTYPVSGRCKNHVKMHGSCGREKLVNGKELDYRRYRLSKEDENHWQFGRNPNMMTRENSRQMFPRYWGSSDSLMAVGDRKSSRCFEAESFTSSSVFKFLDSNDYMEKRKSKDLHKSRLPIIHETDNRRANANRGRKFPAPHQNHYLDIEEGQMVAEDCAQKPITVKKKKKKRPPAHKTVDQETAIAENPRIKELLEKMEKRSKRFNCPTAIRSGSEKAMSLVNHANAATADAKVQRPARKRRWAGN